MNDRLKVTDLPDNEEDMTPWVMYDRVTGAPYVSSAYQASKSSIWIHEEM